MLEQVTITTATPTILKPLLGAAIQNETRLLMHGIKRTQERLAAFEKRFGLSSEEFEHRFNAREINETLDFIDWLMEIEALRLLREQYRALNEARLD